MDLRYPNVYTGKGIRIRNRPILQKLGKQRTKVD